jgi:hypothetical protein
VDQWGEEIVDGPTVQEMVPTPLKAHSGLGCSSGAKLSRNRYEKTLDPIGSDIDFSSVGSGSV